MLKFLEKIVFERIGITGKGTYYILKERQRGERGIKGATKGSDRSHIRTKRASNGPNAPKRRHKGAKK